VGAAGEAGWKNDVSDLPRAVDNAFGRDVLLGEEIARQAAAHRFETLFVDGGQSEDEIAAILEARFRPFLESD
jgi:hypothetical protein